MFLAGEGGVGVPRPQREGARGWVVFTSPLPPSPTMGVSPSPDHSAGEGSG